MPFHGGRGVRETCGVDALSTPPALDLSDALVLSPRVDGMILVVRCGKTPRKALEGTVDEAAKVGARVLGVVVNDVDRSLRGYGYGYGYRCDYGYHGRDAGRQQIEETASELERVS